MRNLYTLIVIVAFANLSFSQAYLKDYLNHKISNSNGELIPVIIKMKNQFDVNLLKQDLMNKKAVLSSRRTALVQQLYRSNSRVSDFDILLNNLKEKYPQQIKNIKKFWVVNAVSCSISMGLLDTVLQDVNVEYIQYDFPVVGEKVTEVSGPIRRPTSASEAELGLVAINARPLWALGYTGRNRIAMNIDTGVDTAHPSLGQRFLGNYLPSSQCWFPYEHPFPYDVDRSAFHGTHTMGTMVGLDRATSDTIGLAFNAFWIASDPIVTRAEDIRPMSDYFLAFQWALNPDGDINTSSDIPDVINNSWGVVYDRWPDCDPIEYDFIEALEAADCAVIFSAGNEGPDDETTGMPASITKDSLNIFSVGALDAADAEYKIASFSSRGPSKCDLSTPEGIKPEVSAPGVNVRSASGNGDYKVLSGTSMAGPHVAGAVLLLREAFPNVTSNEIKNALYQSAIDLGDAGEDNTYGRGLIDVYAAYQYLSESYTPTPPITKQYDLAIDTVEGLKKVTCQKQNHYNVIVKNKGEEAISDFIFRFILGKDTLEERNINVTLQANESYSIPLDVNCTDTLSQFVFQVEKAGIEEFNIYNNYRSFLLTRLFSNTIPFYENFEKLDKDLYQSNFWRVNPDGGKTWSVDSTEGIDDSYRSLKMSFAYYTPNASQLDFLMSAAFDIPSDGNTYLYFKHAYTQYLKSKTDSLFILVSPNCINNSGDTIFKKGGEELKTRSSNLMGNFVPTLAEEWQQNAINLTSYAGQTIYLKFIAKNAGSNNLYIDELRVENGADLSANSIKAKLLELFPNPTMGILKVKNLSNEEFQIFDITGKQQKYRLIQDGIIDVSKLEHGIYFIRSNSGLMGKFIIQK